MRIRNAGRGIHQREIIGIDKLRTLPGDWYAYTNLELYLSPGETRENDVFAVIDDRILLIDLKDWNGKIEGDQGGWFHNNRSMPSPVEKVRANARKIGEVLKRYLRERAKTNSSQIAGTGTPFVQGCVVVTGSANLNSIGPNDRPSVFEISDFISRLPGGMTRSSMLGAPQWYTTPSLIDTSGYWRTILGEFFNVQTGPFRPRQKIYGSYRALSDAASYEHRSGSDGGGVYQEFDAEEDAPGRAPGLLRVWDFTRAATRFQTEEGRREIAGREREVIAYLKERNTQFDIALLQPKTADEDRSVSYWEVFEKRRQLERLRDLNLINETLVNDTVRIDLARGLLERIKALHDLDAAHLDIGSHSVWFELPSSVKISHLFAASYPNLQSLGEHRYQFLTAGWKFPEDLLDEVSDHKRRDVFLLGATIHQIIYGKPPQCTDSESPPDWDPAVDEKGRFSRLHAWFEQALSWDARLRFPDATSALDAFNELLNFNAEAGKAYVRLERFRHWRNQMDLFLALPPSNSIEQSDRTIRWRSVYQGHSVTVKLWRRTCWNDDQLEAPRILDFLERAERLTKTPPIGTSPIFVAAFLGDAIVLVREYVDGVALDEGLKTADGLWPGDKEALSFVAELITNINRMHESGVGHGDLKPQNTIVRRSDDGEIHPVLIDYLEFAPVDEGEVMTTAYSPDIGGRFERDRFAAIAIAEEIIAKTSLGPEAIIRLAGAAQTCRVGPPPNATLLPLLEALNIEINPPQERHRAIEISLGRHEAGNLVADEGRFAVRVGKRGAIVVRGASEEIELPLVDGRFVAARRRPIEQGLIARVARYEIFSFAGSIVINPSEVLDVRALEFIVGELTARSADVTSTGEEKDEDALDVPDDDHAEDEIIEAASTDSESTTPVDVPTLWRRLIDAEQELFTEGSAASDSVYRSVRKRHLVPFDLERGAFDFARHDTVVVERPRRGGGWFDVGLLDVDASSPTAIVIDAAGRSAGPVGPLVRAGDRLRLKSMLETYSRSRRETATSRILSRQSTLPNLIDYFNLAQNPDIGSDVSQSVIDKAVNSYGLNDDQGRAFEKLLKTRGLGLLQGPPGTGKTKFIASFVHHALKNGFVNNVLLASQSHQAVNNAAEEVMRLFWLQGEEPSFVRVGQEGAVSSELRPFHSDRVEARYKDRFRAELRDRLRLIGTRLNIEHALINALTYCETTVLPVFERLKHLSIDDDLPRRISGLKATLESMCAKLGVSSPAEVDWSDDESYERLIALISKRHGGSQARVRNFLAVAKLSRDWLGSVSTRQRSFETFLAGTRSIVAGTCVGLGRSSLGLTQNRFDLVIIDEAARCTSSELAVPMQSGGWILLVGDQFQLEPHHRPDVVEIVERESGIPKREILRSDFERVFHSRYGAMAGHTLSQQYRMLAPIGRVVSKSFYDGVLSHERREPKIPSEVLPATFDLPLLWVATDALGARAQQQASRENRSLRNPSEVDAIIETLRTLDECLAFRHWLRSQRLFREPIGIICTYAAQRDLIRRRLPAAGLSGELREYCRIDTVDSYQGKENPIVILSLVRNNVMGRMFDGKPSIRPGFMSRPNRINVALSRAMDRLVIVGAMNGWPPGGPMYKVVEAFRDEQVAGTARIINAATLEASVTKGSETSKTSKKSRRAVK
jgi:serine/threonine protein kinase